MGAVVVRLLRTLGAALVLAQATHALSAIDCDRVRKLEPKPDTSVVIVYLDATGDNGTGMDRLRSNVQNNLLPSYLKSLGVKVPRATSFLFVICNRARPVIERKDIDDLMGIPVSLALSRNRQGSDTVLTLAVIPQIDRRKPAFASDLDVFGSDPSASNRSVDGWLETLRVNSGHVNGLLGLALGIHHLNQKDGPMAKLLLCKSRVDLRRAGTLLKDSPQSDQDLQDAVEDLLKEAEPLATASSSSVNATLREKIDLACAPRVE